MRGLLMGRLGKVDEGSHVRVIFTDEFNWFAFVAPNLTVPDKLILTESTICSIQPLSQTTTTTTTTTTPPCLVRIQHSESGTVIVQNLLCNPLPIDWNTSRPFFVMMDSVDFRVSEICNHCRLDKVVRPTGKVAVASGFGKIGEGFTFVAVIRGKMVAWRMGDDKWTSIFDHVFFLKVSYGYIRGKFYAIGYGGLAIKVDPDSLKTTQLAHQRQGCPFDILSSVVQSYEVLKTSPPVDQAFAYYLRSIPGLVLWKICWHTYTANLYFII
ncbi:hypothetical protein Tsubulata_012649 [Turnera subulata]|uniref:Uncharacterized protein n=1 Tax=Turnera subulata TaxID=218843 RepID=A0A9Q0FLM2_9ROSI|nr:hypothetical protein Tsubulata_012649 [Turnera subulata]